MTACQCEIAPAFSGFIDMPIACALRRHPCHGVVAVHLVHGGCGRRQIDERGAEAGRLAHEPVVPVAAPDGERRHGPKEPTRIDKNIASTGGIHAVFGPRSLTERRVPTPSEVKRLNDTAIEAAGDAEKLAARARGRRNRGQKVIDKDNVGIDQRQQGMARERVHAREQLADDGRALFVARDLRLVPHLMPRCRRRDARVVAYEDDFTIPAEPRPAADGVVLDDRSLAGEGFGEGEYGEHVGRAFWNVAGIES